MRTITARRIRLLAIAVLGLVPAFSFGLVLASPAGAAPATRYVATTGNDSENDCTDPGNPCRTIVHAVEDEASPGDTVSIAAGTYAESVVINKSLTVVGAGSTGSGGTVISGDTETGDTSIRVQGIDTAPTVTLRDLDVSGNADSDGIAVENADVTVEDCAVSNNDAQGIRVGNGAAAMIISTTSTGNGDNALLLSPPPREAAQAAESQVDDAPSATVSQSVLSNSGASGLAVEAGSANVDHSTLSANAMSGVAVDVGAASVDHSTVAGNGLGGIVNSGTVELSTSTVSGNVAGGAVNLGSGSMDIENSTVTSTKPPQGLHAAAASEFGGVLNLAGAVPAIFQRQSAKTAIRSTSATSDLTAGEVQILGSIVAHQRGGSPDCSGDITDAGYNLDSDSDNTCGLSADMNDAVSVDPLLGPLADNGGPTLTHLPKKGSAAIDAIPLGSANCDSTADDQRGVNRPQGPRCDIGAVEVDQTPLVIHPAALPHGTVGDRYSADITASGGLGPPYEISLVAGHLPAGLTFGDGGVISGTPTESGRFPITVSVDDPVQKDYVIVIEAAAVAPTSTTAPSTTTVPIANTGTNTKPLTAWGITSVLLGVLFLVAAAWVGRERYRRAH